jgi:hypothetical protein
MTMTWLSMVLLHREIRTISRPCVASTSSVVPISSTRKAIRRGVITKALISLAVGV